MNIHDRERSIIGGCVMLCCVRKEKGNTWDSYHAPRGDTIIIIRHLVGPASP